MQPRAVTVEEVFRKVGIAAEEPRARRARAVVPRCTHLRRGVGMEEGAVAVCQAAARQLLRCLHTHP